MGRSMAMKRALSKLGGLTNSNTEESRAVGGHDPPSAAAAAITSPRFSMRRFSCSVHLPAKSGANNRSLNEVSEEGEDNSLTAKKQSKLNGPKNEEQHRARHIPPITNDSSSPTPPASVASLATNPVSPGFTAAASRRRGSFCLRDVLKSAIQGNAPAGAIPKPNDTPGEGAVTGEAVGSGQTPAQDAPPSAAKAAEQHIPLSARGDPEPARSVIGIGANFLRASSIKTTLTGERGAAATNRDMSAEESGNKSASGHERDDSASPPPPPTRNPLRRRVSISFSPKNLRKAVGLSPSQDGHGSITKRPEDSLQPGHEEVADAPGSPVPTFRVHPHPPGLRAAMRAASNVSPTTVRAALRSAMAHDSRGGRGGENSSEHEVLIGGEKQQEHSAPPVVSAAVVPPEPTAPPPLTYQQAQRRRRRSIRRSASFTAGTLQPETTMTAEDNVGRRARAAGSFGDRPSSGRRASRKNRHLRGRSMSASRMGRGSSATFVGLSNPPSPSSMRDDGSGNRSGIGRSHAPTSGGGDVGGASGGFRQRLRQRAAGVGVGVGGSVGSAFHRRGRTRSISPPYGNGSLLGGHTRTTSMSSEFLSLDSSGNWAGPGWTGFGGVDGCGGERHRAGGLPSIVDAVPSWKRPALLKAVQQREEEFTSVKGVGVFVGTWNVNGKKPDFLDPLWLHEWVCPEDGLEGEGGTVRSRNNECDSVMEKARTAEAGHNNSHDGNGSVREETEGDGMEDVYAIGFQELVDLNAVNVAIDIRSQKRSVEWEQRVLSSLNLAALQQANKRRRASAVFSPPLSRSPSPPHGKEQRDARQTKPAPLETEVAVGKTPAGHRGDIGSGDDCILGETNEKWHEVDEECTLVAAPTPAAGSPAAPILTSAASPAALDSGRVEESISGGGAVARGEGGGDETEGTDSCAALLAENGGATFVLVAKEHLVGTWLAVFVRASMLQEVSDIRTGTVSAGMMGVMGNKGGVGVRLRLRSSSLCFITCHLAAHRENVKARNENYHKILREMVFRPLPEAEWRRPQQQQQQRRASSIRSGGSSAPSSPLSGRRLSVSPWPSGSRSPSPVSRRRLSVAASSLSGLLSPRYNADKASPARNSQRVTSRSLSPPTSPDHHKHQRSRAREQRRQHREMAASRSREASPDQSVDGSVSRRRRSMSMSWSTASLSAMLHSSSPAPSAGAQAHCPPPNLAVTAAPSQLASYEPLSPRLAITVVPSATSVGSGGGLPWCDSEGGSTGKSSPTKTGEPLAIGASTGGVTTAAAAGGVRRKIAAIEGRDDLGRKNRPIEQDGGAAEEAPALVGVSGGGVSRLLEEKAASTLSSDRRSSDGRGGETGATLSNVFGEAEAQEEEKNELDGVVGGTEKEASPRSVEQEQRQERRGEGGPTQVLRVPEIAARDTDELLGIQDHDVVFWFGDLNYRIESSVAALEVLDHAVSGGLPFLAANDQLNSAREAGAAFEGFHEDPIDFPPTYKYTAGTDQYDTRNDKKFRAPAWCDRILSWTPVGGAAGDKPHFDEPSGVDAIKAGRLRQLAYRRSETPLTSDHKPVSASFRFWCRQVDSAAYAKVLLEVVEKTTKGASEGQPQVHIVEGGNTVDFGNVRYGVPQSRSAWIVNSGRVPASFRVHSSQHPPVLDKRKLTDGKNEPDEPEEAKKGTGELRVGQGGGEEVSQTLGATVDWNRVDVRGLQRAEDVEGSGGDDRDSQVDTMNGRPRELAFFDIREDKVASASSTSSTSAAVAVESSGWCSVSPESGVLLPGDKLELQLTALVQGAACRAFAPGRTPRKLEDVLVLRIERGNDRYISVSGNYAPSVYGSTLQAMMETPVSNTEAAFMKPGVVCEGGGGIATVDLIESGSEEWGRVANGKVRIPWQLWRMVEALLESSAFQQPGLFVEKGVELEVHGIQEAVDSGSALPSHGALSMAEALVGLLASLSVSIIPENVYQALSGAKDFDDIGARARSFLIDLPPLHRDVFVYLLSFFKFLLAHAAKNGLTAERLLFVQRSCFLPGSRRPNQREGQDLRLKRKSSWQQPGGDSDRGEASTQRGMNSSIRQIQGSRLEGCGGRTVRNAKAGEGGGVVSESGEDVLGILLYFFLTGK